MSDDGDLVDVSFVQTDGLGLKVDEEMAELLPFLTVGEQADLLLGLIATEKLPYSKPEVELLWAFHPLKSVTRGK